MKERIKKREKRIANDKWEKERQQLDTLIMRVCGQEGVWGKRLKEIKKKKEKKNSAKKESFSESRKERETK